MAKNKETKLELVPAADSAIQNDMVMALVTTELPKGVKKLTMPPMIKPETVPVGSMVSGEIVALVASLSSRKDMEKSKLIHMRHESGAEFLFPLTGVIKKAIGGDEKITENIGNTLFLKRTPDGSTTKYGGVKKVYMFDVYIQE